MVMLLLSVGFAGTSVFDAMQRSQLPLSETPVGYEATTAQVRVEREDLTQSEGAVKLSLRVRPPPLSRVRHRAEAAVRDVDLGKERAEEEAVRLEVATAYAHVVIDQELYQRIHARLEEVRDREMRSRQALQEGVIDAMEAFEARRQLTSVEAELAAVELALDANEAALHAALRVDTLELQSWPEVHPVPALLADTAWVALQAQERVVRASRLPTLDFVEADVSLEGPPEFGVSIGVGVPLPSRSRELQQLRAASTRASRDLQRRRSILEAESAARTARQAHWRQQEDRARAESADVAALRRSLPAGDQRETRLASLAYEADVRVLEARRERMLVECEWLSQASP